MPPILGALRTSRNPRLISGVASVLLAAGATASSAAMIQVAPARAQPASLPPASTRPFPAIEAGMHTANIRRIGVDAAGRYAVTASDDKTARVWDLASGKQLAVLRVPVGENHEGKLYAVALSPDGRLVALGGWTGSEGSNGLYLFDRASGRMVQRIGGLPNVINHLAFSADGRHLAAALGSKNGIRVYGGGPPWKEVARDTDYGGGSYSVDFDRSGRLVATCEDGRLRLYDTALRRIAVREVDGGKDPYFARFSPDGRRIAVGFHDSTAVSVVSGADLSPLFSADTKGVDNGELGRVAWSADGQTLVAAGRNGLPNGQRPLRSWDTQGRGTLRTRPLANVTNTVMDLRPLAGGRLVYASGDPAWGVVDADGRQLLGQGPPSLDHRGNFDAFRLSPSAEVLEFKQKTWRDGKWQRSLARFDLATRRLAHNVSPLAGLQAPRTAGLPVTDWEDSTTPRLGDKLLKLDPYETPRSLAVSRDGQRFALGAEWSVNLFDARGQRLWRKPVPGAAWLVNLSDDGRYVVAALGDGTIRWYRSSDGSEALALFVHGDGQRWVVWTPEGFYDAAPGGDQLIGYQLNQGRDQAGQFVGSDQLARVFYRPDLIARRLAGDEKAIQAAVAQVGDVRQVLQAGLAPSLDLLSPASASVSGDYELKFRIAERAGGVGPVEIRINGVAVEGRTDPPSGGVASQRIRLPEGRNVVSAVVYSRDGKQASRPVEAVVTVAPSGERPTLYVLAVGVTGYRESQFRKGVRFAAADAIAMAQALGDERRLAMARLAPPVVLTEADATRERIEAELEKLAQRVQPSDLFVLHLAGHGMAIDGEYYFLPWDVRYNESLDMVIKNQGLSGARLDSLLRLIKANKSLVLLDTCNSGAYQASLGGRSPEGRSITQTDKYAIDRFAKLSGRVVLAAAGDEKMALESRDNKHGIFTAAILSGILGAADRNGNGIVDVGELANYVEDEVVRITRELFHYEQTPMRMVNGQNFPITRKSVSTP